MVCAERSIIIPYFATEFVQSSYFGDMQNTLNREKPKLSLLVKNDAKYENPSEKES